MQIHMYMDIRGDVLRDYCTVLFIPCRVILSSCSDVCTRMCDDLGDDGITLDGMPVSRVLHRRVFCICTRVGVQYACDMT